MATATDINYFRKLEHKVILKIFKHFSIKELSTISLVSKEFRALANSDYLWKYLCRKHLGPVQLDKSSFTSWKRLFQSSGMLFKAIGLTRHFVGFNLFA